MMISFLGLVALALFSHRRRCSSSNDCKYTESLFRDTFRYMSQHHDNLWVLHVWVDFWFVWFRLPLQPFAVNLFDCISTSMVQIISMITLYWYLQCHNGLFENSPLMATFPATFLVLRVGKDFSFVGLLNTAVISTAMNLFAFLCILYSTTVSNPSKWILRCEGGIQESRLWVLPVGVDFLFVGNTSTKHPKKCFNSFLYLWAPVVLALYGFHYWNTCCNDHNPKQIFFGDHTFYVVQSSRSISVLPVRVDFLFVRLWFNININTSALIIHSLWWTFKICLKQYGHTCWSRTVLRIASFVVNSKPKKPPSSQVGDMYRLQRKNTHTHRQLLGNLFVINQKLQSDTCRWGVGCQKHQSLTRRFKKILFPTGGIGKMVNSIVTLTYFTTKVMRLGEATNPGPLQVDQFKIGLVNPTTVLHREAAICELDLDFLGLAETSATKPVQLQVQKNLKSKGYSSLWSIPVDNHRTMINGQQSLRGAAAGVAAITRLPARPFRDPLPAVVLQSSRVLLTYTQFGATTILIAIFYGFANGNENAKEESNTLLEVVVEALLAHPGPALLMGDFNHDIETLPALDKLLQAGYTSITTLYQSIYQQDMPKTYQEATTRDLLLFSGELSGHVTDIQVCKTAEFPGHCPVIAELSLPIGGITKQIWKIPKSFLELEPSIAILEHQYHSLPQLDLTEDAMTNMQKWTQKVETAVDMTIQIQHKLDPNNQPYSGLPTPYRGKCLPTTLRTAAFRAFTPKARVGDFEPEVETRSVAASQQVRQVRRIQSLRRRITKLQTYAEVWPRTWLGLQQEWTAILKAPGFGRSFTSWICNNLKWPFVTGQLPKIHMLEALEEAVKSLLQHTMHQDQKIHNQKRFFNHQIDHLFNYDRQAYQLIKEPPLQFIQSLSTTFDAEATVVQQDPKFLEIKADLPYTPTIGTSVKTHSGECIVLDTKDTLILTKWKHIPEIPPFEIGQTIKVTFSTSGMQPKDIHTALTEFWKPLWNRDSQSEAKNPECWNNVADQLHHVPLPKLTEHFDISSLDLWKKVIHNTNSKSVPGADGWYFEELKILPDQAISELITIFEHPSFQGFDAPHMRARIVPLPKKQQVDTADQTRPITVMPTLYRVWSAVVAHQIMKDAHTILPEGIVGFVKGRSGLHAMHKLAWHIEKTRFRQQHASGLTLDLTKAFNQFPRVPVMMILQAMGVPTKYLEHWLHSLTAMEKYFDHRNWISEPMTTTTGVVEGDSLSVVGMIGIAVFWWQAIANQGVQPMAYADNLSWYVDEFHKHRHVLQQTILIFDMLRIPIDWNKTWVWGTSKADYRSWELLAADILPQGTQLQQLHSAVDLGVVMQYSSANRLLKITTRLQEAMQRLHRLYRQQLSIDVVAKIIQTAIWPKAFYGQEVSLLGSHHFTELRSQAAKTLLKVHNPGMSALALVLTQQNLDDPEVFVLVNAVRSAKALLWTLSAEEQTSFFQVASQAKGVCAKTRGPASALKGYLLRLGVQITPSGDLLFLSGVTLNLINTPFQVLRHHIRDEWLRDLPLLTSERTSVRNAPMINRRLTQQTLAKFYPAQRVKLLREVCNTFQLQEQKKHWTGQDTDQCPHCNGRDSRRHRATQCEALKDVFVSHEQTIMELQDLHDIHFDLPVVFRTPFHDLLLQCFHKTTDTVFVPSTVTIIEQHIEQGHVPTFFSDGSCFGATSPGLWCGN